MRAHLLDTLDQLTIQRNIYSVVVGIIMEASGEVHIDPIGPTDSQSLGPMTGSTGAAISAIRRPGRQRLRRPISSGCG